MVTKHTIRPMKESDLEKTLNWRNHMDIRSYMFSTEEIHIDEHRNWYANACENPGLSLLIYERNGKASGFVNITRSNCPEVANWGFYLAPDAPKGSGRTLGIKTLNYAFTQLSLNKICGQVLSFNARSIIFHTNLGFTEEGRLRDQHFYGNQFHDVLCFGLLSREWKTLQLLERYKL